MAAAACEPGSSSSAAGAAASDQQQQSQQQQQLPISPARLRLKISLSYDQYLSDAKSALSRRDSVGSGSPHSSKGSPRRWAAKVSQKIV